MAKSGSIALILIIILAWCNESRAHDLWLTSGFLTKHLTHEATYAQANDYRENNYGIGVEYRNVTAGIFKNSMSETSRYVGYRWMPLKHDGFSAGLFAGVIDGYSINSGGFFPIAAPVISWEGKRVGVNLLALPKYRDDMDALIAVQFKLKVK